MRWRQNHLRLEHRLHVVWQGGAGAEVGGCNHMQVWQEWEQDIRSRDVVQHGMAWHEVAQHSTA